jgi:hypothetical protein
MRSPIDWRDASVSSKQTMRDLEALPWAAERATRISVKLSKMVLFGLLPVCFMAWLVTGMHH